LKRESQPEKRIKEEKELQVLSSFKSHIKGGNKEKKGRGKE